MVASSEGIGQQRGGGGDDDEARGEARGETRSAPPLDARATVGDLNDEVDDEIAIFDVLAAPDGLDDILLPSMDEEAPSQNAAARWVPVRGADARVQRLARRCAGK